MSDRQGWTNGPNTRGTFDILWLCLTTLALCVWTAVHPNISLKPGTKNSLVTRLGMMLVAIVFPEVIISSAWRQLRSSHWLRAQVKCLHLTRAENLLQKVAPRPRDSSATDDTGAQRALLPASQLESEQATNSPIRRKLVATGKVPVTPSALPLATENEPDSEPLLWTSEQAFFAVMGGFAIENDYLNESNVRVTIRRILTVDGVLQLAKFGLLPHIDPEAISERSKADNIAKLFVLSQIIWFGLQVIGRLASKIPVTLLELHTVIHVACAIVIYVLWMNKPYDVRGSILLTDPDAKAVAALCNFESVRAKLYAKSWTDYQIARERYWKDRVVRASNNLLDHDPPPSPPLKEELTKAVSRFSTDQEVDRSVLKDSEEHMLEALAASARQGVAVLKRRGGYSDRSINERSWDLLRANSENFTIKTVWGGWSTNTGHKMSIDKGVHFLFNFLYGGGHLSAWASSSFPTVIERVLWIAAAFVLTCMPLFGVMWILWWKAVSSKRRWLYLVRNGDLDILAAPFFVVLMLAYFFSRCYFLIESLISLRLLPPGAFLTVNWARYLPHIA